MLDRMSSHVKCARQTPIKMEYDAGHNLLHVPVQGASFTSVGQQPCDQRAQSEMLKDSKSSSTPQSQHRPLGLAWQLQAVLLLRWGHSQWTTRASGTRWSCQAP